jgi:hypothetical protein
VSLRDRILSANDIQKDLIHVDAWDVDVEVRTMTAIERARLIAVCTTEAGSVDMEKMYPLLVIAGVYDPESGAPVFTHEDVDSLQEKSAGAIEFIAQKVMEASGMKEKAIDEEGKGN